MTTGHSDTDLLTVEQFAAKMQVSRTTVFEWLKNGALEEGKHYFKIGRIIRFVWDAALFLGRSGEKNNHEKKPFPDPRINAATMRLPRPLSTLTIENVM